MLTHSVTWQQTLAMGSFVGHLKLFVFSCLPLPSLYLLLVGETVAWIPGVGAHGWVAGTASHGSGTWSRGWLAGLHWRPLDIPCTHLHIAMQLISSRQKTPKTHALSSGTSPLRPKKGVPPAPYLCVCWGGGGRGGRVKRSKAAVRDRIHFNNACNNLCEKFLGCNYYYCFFFLRILM